ARRRPDPVAWAAPVPVGDRGVESFAAVIPDRRPRAGARRRSVGTGERAGRDLPVRLGDLGTQHEAVDLDTALRKDVYRAEGGGVVLLEALVELHHVLDRAEARLRRRRAVDVDLPPVLGVELEAEAGAARIVAFACEVLPRFVL